MKTKENAREVRWGIFSPHIPTDRSADSLRLATLQRLRIGQRVRIERWRTDIQKPTLMESRKGTVVAFYRYIFSVEIDGMRECFRYNQFMGLENERVVKA